MKRTKKSNKKRTVRKEPFTSKKGKSSIVIFEDTKPHADVKKVLNGAGPLCIISNEFAQEWNSYKIVAAVYQQFNKPPILTKGEENGWIIVGISPDKIRDAIAKIIDGRLPKWKLKLKLRTVRKIQMSRAVLIRLAKHTTMLDSDSDESKNSGSEDNDSEDSDDSDDSDDSEDSSSSGEDDEKTPPASEQFVKTEAAEEPVVVDVDKEEERPRKRLKRINQGCKAERLSL